MKTPLNFAARNDSLVTPEDVRQIDLILHEAVDFDAMIVRQVAEKRQGDHPGTERIDWSKVTREGAAKIFNIGGADNVPMIDLHTTPFSHRVVSLVIGYQVTAQERRAADMGGRDLVTQKTLTASRYLTVKENEIGFLGSSPNGIEGLLAYTGTQTYSVPQGASKSTYWADKTAEEILHDVMMAWGKVQLRDAYHATMAIFNTGDTKWLHQPYSSVAPMSVWEIIQNRGWFPAGMLMSKRIPSGTFVVLQNTPDILQMAMPLDVYQYPPYVLNSMTTEIDFEERYAGFIVYRPLGICIASGVSDGDEDD